MDFFEWLFTFMAVGWIVSQLERIANALEKMAHKGKFADQDLNSD